MAESIPAIRVTDPQSRDTSPQDSHIAQRSAKDLGLDSGSAGSASPEDGESNTSKTFNGAASSAATSLRSPPNGVSTQRKGRTVSSPPAPVVEGTSPTIEATIDPLSQHILRRTNQPGASNFQLLRPTTSGASAASGTSGTSDDKSSDDKGVDGHGKNNSNLSLNARSDTGLSGSSNKDRKKAELNARIKGVSFLSRIIDRTKKRDTDDDASDTAAEAQSDLRPEGMEAQVFAQPVSNIAYEPRHAQPPAYIRVRAKYKKDRDFDRLFLAQELQGTKQPDRYDDAKSIRSTRSARSRSGVRLGGGSRSGAAEVADTTWALQFSKDGKYLAAAGQDKTVRVWAVISSPEDRNEASTDDAASDFSDQKHLRLSAPVFKSKPVREFEGHTATILDLSWSKNNFLLSSSMDKTVRLWHVSRDECLCAFKHNDFVTSIAFHPSDDRFFLAGSLDAKLRLWSIPDKTVAYWSNLGDMITAVEFTPDGRYAIGGCLNGLCMFYETEGLKYQTQIHVRSTHGKNAKGSKITNIQALNYPPNNPSGVTKLLITSNDSRVRLYNLRDKALEIKFKGIVNDSSQIRATFSDDARYIACGSEDSKAFIWTMSVEEGEKRNKRPVEIFTASDTITTCVAFAPTKTRQLLGRSGDPMYDICNPPPITLLSRDEEKVGSRPSSRVPTEDGNSIVEPEVKHRKQDESPAYIARSTHKNGNIIVTADFNGRIKVFRQDCAWAKRSKDNWDASSVFTKASNMRRTASIATRGSSRSLRSANGSVRTQPPSERILSWRQGITSTPSIAGSSLRSGKAGGGDSPRNSMSHVSLPQNKTQGRPESARGAMAPPPLPVHTGNSHSHEPAKSKHGETDMPRSPSSSEFKAERLQADTSNPLGMVDEHASLWWKLAKDAALLHLKNHPDGSDFDLSQSGHGESAPQGGLELPNSNHMQRTMSRVSTLSIERSDISRSGSSDDEFMDALDRQHSSDSSPMEQADQTNHYRHRGSNSEVVCRYCKGNSFKAARSKRDGITRLCCTECGTPA